ncbi:response regulator [Rhodosalinus sp. FB01]|uniref:response regulator n=1 Tax=Rhodosalinus sp. FB01 TaxID=3239194 RepID=UPI0035238A05
MDEHDRIFPLRRPAGAGPLAGLTVLAVEDSRFASEALRLLCLRSGARIRRADSLAAARRHLAVYRPSVLLVDMGLPDGSGAQLLAEAARATAAAQVILGLSGDPCAEGAALAAGAHGFLPKPLPGLAAFQRAVLSRLPDSVEVPAPGRAAIGAMPRPDPIAYHDDLEHAARALSGKTGPAGLDYVAQFLGGVARIAEDAPLAEAARALAAARAEGRAGRSALAHVTGLLQERLSERAAM